MYFFVSLSLSELFHLMPFDSSARQCVLVHLLHWCVNMAATDDAAAAVGPADDDELTVVRMLEAQEIALRHQLDLVTKRIQEQEEATKGALQEVHDRLITIYLTLFGILVVFYCL